MMVTNSLTAKLKEFKGISLEELGRAPLMNRVDEKFAFPMEMLEQFLDALKDHYDVLSINDQEIFAYSSQYYDDKNFQFFHDHHRALPNRFKVRIRKYLDSGLTFLEVKEKIKGRTDKKRIATSDFKAQFSENEQEFLNYRLRKNVNLKPVITNNYKRITLVNKHAEERLTIDFDICNGQPGKDKHPKNSLNNVVIAELKQPIKDRNSPFYQLMKKARIRPFRISKFCFAMMDIYDGPELKANRFKPKKLYLNKLATYV